MKCQKHRFALSGDISYLNHAYMSPQCLDAQEAGQQMIAQLSNPATIGERDFFEPAKKIRGILGGLLGGEPDRFALTPSCSYSIANIAHQLKPAASANIALTEGQFPSNVYSWMRLCKNTGCSLRTAAAPPPGDGRGKAWNESILQAIDKDTFLVAIPPLHWTDGTLFDLEAIRQATKSVGALLVVDASQAVCAMPLDIASLKPDALVSAGYKWLLWPYGTGMAWFGPAFDEGIPMEENWIAHRDAEDFSKLLYYNADFEATGKRFSSGEHPAMIHTAMQLAACRLIDEWGIDQIDQYIGRLAGILKSRLLELGLWLEDPQYSANHLFGVHFDDHETTSKVRKALEDGGVYVSQRGNALRVSIYVYNDENDVDRLVEAVRRSL